MRYGIGIFVHVNFMVRGQSHTEFPFYSLSWFSQKTRAKLAVFPSF